MAFVAMKIGFFSSVYGSESSASAPSFAGLAGGSGASS
jgi:hypothetical protein